MRATELEAVVMGRVCVDLYPMQLRVPLEQVEGFHKYVGGFAGNVATGLARLGVRTAIVSAVGDDGHGRYVRDWLTAQGVDCRWLGTHPTLRTALAFCEAWPPDNFPITFYRTPTCPDWELTVVVARPGGPGRGAAGLRQRHRLRDRAVAPGHAVAAGGAGRRRRHHRARPGLAGRAVGRPGRLRRLHARRRTPGQTWRSAPTRSWPRRWARRTPSRLLDLGVGVVANKHGGRGVTVYVAGHEPVVVPPHPVEVVNGLGAGDAFAAAFGWRLLRGDQPAAAADRRQPGRRARGRAPGLLDRNANRGRPVVTLDLLLRNPAPPVTPDAAGWRWLSY